MTSSPTILDYIGTAHSSVDQVTCVLHSNVSSRPRLSNSGMLRIPAQRSVGHDGDTFQVKEATGSQVLNIGTYSAYMVHNYGGER